MGHRVEVEDDVADLAAGALVDRQLVVAFEVLDVRRGQRTPCDVDVTLLQAQLHVVRIREVPHLHGLGLRFAQRALVLRVRLVGDELVERVRIDRERAGERFAVDDLLVRGDLIRSEDVLVDDRTRRTGEHQRERLVILAVERELDREVIRRLDGLDGAEQRGRTVRVLDLQLPLEAELHVGGRELVAVRERQSLLELHLVRARISEVSGLRDVGLRLRRARGVGQEEREDLLHHEERAVVIGAGRVDDRHLVSGADGDGAAALAFPFASGRGGRAGGEDECRRADGGGQHEAARFLHRVPSNV